MLSITLITPFSWQALAMAGTSGISNVWEPGVSSMTRAVLALKSEAISAPTEGEKNSTSTPIRRNISSANSRVGP